MDASQSATTPPASEPRRAVDTLTQAETKQLTADEILKLKFPDHKPLYVAHGKWAWVNGEEFLSNDPGTPLGSGLEGQVDLKVSYINDKSFVHISKMTSVWDSWKSFFTSLYLNATSKYLRPLQGDCVPWVISVNHCLGGRIGVSLDLPHPTGWREADMFLKESQKEAIIAAYQKLHDRGVLHGDAEYRHMLIGDDEKVTIIDFGLSKVVNPDEWDRKAGLEGCTPSCIRTEMRKVKFMLDWKDSRETEFRLAKLRLAREARDRDLADSAKTDPFETVEVPKETLSEEEQQQPDGGLRLTDLDAWSCGDTWTAHRYELDCYTYKVVVKKSEIPHPPTPIPSSAPAVVVEPTSDSVDKEPFQEEPEQQPRPTRGVLNVDPATSNMPRYEKGDRHRTAIQRLLVRQQKEQQEQTDKEEGKEQHKVEKGDKNKNTEREENIEREGKNNGTDEKNGDTKGNRAGEETEQKKSETNKPEQKEVTSEPVMEVVQRHGKADRAKVNPRQRRVRKVPAKEPGVLATLPEERTTVKTKPIMTVSLDEGNAELPRKPAMKRRLEEEPNEPEDRTGQKNVDSDLSKAVRFVDDWDADDNHEPAKKRQKTASTSRESEGKATPNPSSDNARQMDSDDISSAGLTSSGSSTFSDEGDVMHPLLDEGDADPTSYQLDSEEHAFLRREAVRAFARFTTASTRVQPHETGYSEERHNLEKCRSELLRIIIMLPRKSRTTLWTNMGQPDVRALLGLLPEPPRPREENSSLTSPLPQPAHAMGTARGNSSTMLSRLRPSMRREAPGKSSLRRISSLSEHSPRGLPLEQKEDVDVKSSTREKLQRRLEIERRIAMPPPPPPTNRTESTAPQTVSTFRAPSVTPRRPPVHHSAGNRFPLGSTSQPSSSSALQELLHGGLTSAQRSASPPSYHSSLLGTAPQLSSSSALQELLHGGLTSAQRSASPPSYHSSLLGTAPQLSSSSALQELLHGGFTSAQRSASPPSYHSSLLGTAPQLSSSSAPQGLLHRGLTSAQRSAGSPSYHPFLLGSAPQSSSSSAPQGLLYRGLTSAQRSAGSPSDHSFLLGSAPQSSSSSAPPVSTSAQRSAGTPPYHRFYNSMREMIDEARMANSSAVFSYSVPPHILASEDQSMRRYSAPAGPSNPTSRPMGRPLIRTLSSWDLRNLQRFHQMRAAEGSPTVPKRESSPPGTVEEASQRGMEGASTGGASTGTNGGTSAEAPSMHSETKRKREDTEDSKALHLDDGEQPDAKRRKN